MPGEIGATLDGITSKPPYTGVVNHVAGVVQGITDAMEEIKVTTTGVSAEYGHTAGLPGKRPQSNAPNTTPTSRRHCAWSPDRA